MFSIVITTNILFEIEYKKSMIAFTSNELPLKFHFSSKKQLKISNVKYQS